MTIEILNKKKFADAREVLANEGFTAILNKSVYPCREFFEKDGVQYSFNFPIWNKSLSKVMIKQDNTNI